jgi:hypothetical protein
MYLDEASIDRTSLYQGDIIADIQLFGAITLSSISITTDNQGNKNGWLVPQKPDFGIAMVLSHSCEIDRANLMKVTSIILAPLRDINKINKQDKIAEIVASNIINEETTYSYLKYFYLSGHVSIGFSDGAIVDFSKCFSIRNKSYNMLLEKKRAQLKEESADSMARKLALYYYRNRPKV